MKLRRTIIITIYDITLLTELIIEIPAIDSRKVTMDNPWSNGIYSKLKLYET